MNTFKCRIFFSVLTMIMVVNSAHAQSFATDKYYYFFKTWNFLKYYHPMSAQGRVSADSVFFATLPMVDDAKDMVGFNTAFSTMLASYPSAASTTGTPTHFKNVMRQNFNQDWLFKNKFLPDNIRRQLESVYIHRYTGATHHYLPEKNYSAEIPNESPYPVSDSQNLERPLRLLALAKIQGAIDYLFPHKYLADQDLDRLVKNNITLFDQCSSRTEYELLLLRLVSSLNDTHSFDFIRQVKNRQAIFRSGFIPPFAYEVFNDGIIVTEPILKDVCSKSGIKKGDIITHINGAPVKKIIDTLTGLISVSNRATMLYRLSIYTNNLVWRSASQDFTLRTAAGKKDHALRFVSSRDSSYQTILAWVIEKRQPKTPASYPELLNDSIAIFRAENLIGMLDGVPDSLVDNAMDRILGIAASQKAIIFDMRRFIDWGGFVYTYVPRYFGVDSNHFADYYQVNRDQLGTYVLNTVPSTYHSADIRFRNKGYKGKVIILTAPGTLSQTEWNVMSLQNLFPQSITFGEQSAGADGDAKDLMLPGGYSMPFTGNAVFYPDGTPAQRQGVRINKRFTRTKKSVIADGDPLLEEAVRLANRQ